MKKSSRNALKKGKIINIDELDFSNDVESAVRETTDKLTNAKKYAKKYEKSLKAARAVDGIPVNDGSSGKYSLRTRIKNNPWLGSRPASKAIKWLYNEVFKNPKKYRYSARLMHQGGLFTFKYFNPKYKGTSVLPWFDKYPLVISLGPRVTEEGPRNLGFNLHLLPPRIRIIVICYIFEIYKAAYRRSIFFKKDIHPVAINYDVLMNKLRDYGAAFAVRMYIPQRQQEIVHFPLSDWYKAIFIPSQGYDSIRSKRLVKEWKDYCRSKKISISEKINWKAII